MKKRWLKVLLILFGVLLLVCITPVIYNQVNSKFENLNETDQTILTELNTYFEKDKQSKTWDGFSLAEHPILALNGTIGKAFLINPDENINSVFAKEIKMPSDFSIKVYRISIAAPQLFQFMTASNFNILGNTYSVFDNDVYFTKYNEDSVEAKQNSKHYIAFLTHEAFHCYMQNEWPRAGRFDTSLLTDEDLSLMEEQYAVFGKIYSELNTEQPDGEKLIALAKEYVDITEKRIQANPEYMKAELTAETEEGTATYVGMHASKAVGYDLQIMHFVDEKLSSDVIEWPFDTVIPLIKSGNVDRGTIASEWVYQTGALLCELIDELDIPEWQQQLNGQTIDSPMTLYDIIDKYVDELPES